MYRPVEVSILVGKSIVIDGWRGGCRKAAAMAMYRSIEEAWEQQQEEQESKKRQEAAERRAQHEVLVRRLSPTNPGPPRSGYGVQYLISRQDHRELRHTI